MTMDLCSVVQFFVQSPLSVVLPLITFGNSTPRAELGHSVGTAPWYPLRALGIDVIEMIFR